MGKIYRRAVQGENTQENKIGTAEERGEMKRKIKERMGKARMGRRAGDKVQSFTINYKFTIYLFQY